MEFIIKIKGMFGKKRCLFFILILLVLLQLTYSFIFPSVGFTGTGHGWLTLQDLIQHKRSPLGAVDTSIIDKFSSIFSEYNVNADGAEYIVLAKNFPQYYFKNPIYLSRPMYSFLIAVIAFLPRLFFDSYATVFVSAIFLNFLLAVGAVLLLYLLVEKIISSRVAFLSSLLFIFSPFMHAGLIQPIAEIYGAFMIVTGLYLLYNYVKNPSFLKLVVFSLIIGAFLLGKLLYIMPIFILMLAVYFKRYREGASFFIIHLLPLAFWYFWVTQVFKLRFFENAVENFNSGVWVFNLFSWDWHKTYQMLLAILPQFISAIIYAFLAVPLIFAFLGFKKLYLQRKDIISFSFALSFLIVFFIANFYFARHAFLLFPLVYPLAVLGIDRTADYLKQYGGWYAAVFYVAIFAFLLVVSSVNIYKVFSYL
jgi:hypothetical protein